MLTNDQMKAGRFARWAKARAKVAAIRNALSAGNVVMICTATRAVQYGATHVDMFKATKTGAFVARGKNWDCIDFSTIRIGR